MFELFQILASRFHRPLTFVAMLIVGAMFGVRHVHPHGDMPGSMLMAYALFGAILIILLILTGVQMLAGHEPEMPPRASEAAGQ